jgi:hypothetical protein
VREAFYDYSYHRRAWWMSVPRGLRLLCGRLFCLLARLGSPLPSWTRPWALEAVYQSAFAHLFRENTLWTRARGGP